ncbi:titin-like [Xyrauchen texanus]|uniref:titin-like n=1 Tax=Xyrauchen texanus TaxID=154827 RepID=UPI002241D8CF|nr:titin-like [Xyrauchen texanus]
MESSVLPLILLLMCYTYSDQTPGSEEKTNSETDSATDLETERDDHLGPEEKTNSETDSATDLETERDDHLGPEETDSGTGGGSNSQNKPVLTVNPETSPIFRGETVTLTCDVQGTEVTDWTYRWFCDGVYVQYSNEREYTITLQNTKTCKCERSRTSHQSSSHWSNEVTLTVIDEPVLTVNPKTSPIFRGETVTLTCDVQGTEVTDWTYRWFCDGVYVQYSNEREYTITLQNTKTCKCERSRTSHQSSSHWSNEVTLTVIDEPVLTVNPETSPIFRGETVTLTCDVQGTEVTDWTYRWFCDGVYVQYSNEREYTITLQNTKTCKCERSRTSHQSSSHWSNEVTLTVIDEPVLTVNPETSPIFRGETVTLTCDVQGTEVTDWTYRWFCDGVYVQYSNEREYTITLQNTKTCKCERSRTSHQSSSHWSNEVTLTVIDKPVLTVNPETSPIFRGETVTLTCDIQGTEETHWTYRFQCDGVYQYSHVQESNKKEIKIPASYSGYSIRCKCFARRTSTQFNTDWSNEVSFRVIDKPVLTVNPETSPIFRGETVTLTCDVQGTEETDWTYRFQCDGGYSVYQDSNEKQFKFTASYIRYSKCKCYATRTSTQISTDWSDEVSFRVIDKPKPVLTVNPVTSPIFSGETVTLTCDVQGTEETDWTYRFQCDRDVQDSNEKQLKFTASYSRYSRTCWCSATRTSTKFSTSWSDEVSFTVIERPKPEVRVNPDHHVFRGETVTLTCDIQTQTHTEWRYSWIKDDSVNPVNSESSDAAGTKTIRSVKVSDGGQYRCRAQRGNYDTQFSNTVQVTVEDSKLNPELTSDTAGAALTGNTVTLICHMTQTAGWDFYWYKHTQNSEKNKTETNSYRVHIDSVSDGGQYWCRAGRGESVYYTNYSDALWVNVTAQRPSVFLIISPSRSQHFSSHSLSLNCEDHNNSTGWTVRRNTDSERMKDCSSTGSTCEISSLKTSDTGVYWCQSQSGEHSPHINITVHDGDVILESSVHPVIEGDTLTLHCLHRSTNSSILTADFYKDGSLLQNQTTGEMSIPTVSKSHEGFYSCKHGERGQSPESWISVTDRSSSHLVIWVVVGLSVAVLLLISLILLWRYKHNKDQQCINQQTSVQNQRTRPGESPTENCPLQSGCDPIYDEVETNYKKSTGASADEVTYSELTIKNKISVDKDAGKRDVLIEMKTEDNQRGKSSECEDTVYSDLKQNTDRGGSAGVDATYAQVFNHRKKKTCKN